MDIKQIEERIEKKQAQIAKIQKRVDKWQKAISDEGFKKEYKWDCQDGLYYNRNTQQYDIPYDQFKEDRFAQYEASCNNEIRYAKRDLEEAQVQLEKYYNVLKAEQVKQAKLDSERIKVIMDFLENWKVKVTEFIHKDVQNVKKYYELNHEACEVHNKAYWLVSEGKYPDVKAAYKASDDLDKEAMRVKAMCSDVSFEVYDKHAENLTDDAQLKKILDEEADRKYLKLVDSITAKVGEITDFSCLCIGPKGDIEGFITGTKGKVHVETIGAGGYNNNIILDSGRHGQCYHYRTLINKIK